MIFSFQKVEKKINLENTGRKHFDNLEHLLKYLVMKTLLN